MRVPSMARRLTASVRLLYAQTLATDEQRRSQWLAANQRMRIDCSLRPSMRAGASNQQNTGQPRTHCFLPCGGVGWGVPAAMPVRRAEQGTGADRLQPPLVPRSGFRRRLTAGVGLLGAALVPGMAQKKAEQ